MSKKGSRFSGSSMRPHVMAVPYIGSDFDWPHKPETKPTKVKRLTTLAATRARKRKAKITLAGGKNDTEMS